MKKMTKQGADELKTKLHEILTDRAISVSELHGWNFWINSARFAFANGDPFRVFSACTKSGMIEIVDLKPEWFEEK